MDLKNKLLSGALWTLLDKLVNQVGYFVLMVYLARRLLPEDFGIVGMLMVFVLFVDTLASSGFSHALVQRSQHLTVIEKSTAFVVNLCASIVLYALMFFVAPMIAGFYKMPALEPVSKILFALIVFNALGIVPKADLTIGLKFKVLAFINTMAFLLSSVCAIWMVELGLTYWALVGMMLVKSAAQTGLAFYFSRWAVSIAFSKEAFKRLFGFGSNLMITGILSNLVNNLYVLLIGKFFAAKEVGLFTQASNLTNNLSGILSSVLQGVTYPIMTSLQDNPERLKQVYSKLMQVTMLVSIPCFIGFCAIAQEFTLLFLGEKWRLIIPVLIALALARMVTPISSINLNLLNAIGRSDLFLRVDLCKMPMTLLALFATTPFGINVVAYGMVATSFIAFFINAYYPGKFYGFGGWVQLKMMAPMILAAAGMYASVAFIHFDSLYLLLICKVLVGGLVYTGLCYLLRVPAFFDLLAIIKSRKNRQAVL